MCSMNSSILVQMQEMEHLRIVEKPWVCVCKGYVKFEGENNSTIIWTLSPCKCDLLLLLSCFSRIRLCATPETAAHQAPPSLGLSKQEHWSGLPFPSPRHESEKGKWSRSVMSDSSQPHGLQPTRLLRPWDFPGKSTGVGCHCLLPIYTILYASGVQHGDWIFL